MVHITLFTLTFLYQHVADWLAVMLVCDLTFVFCCTLIYIEILCLKFVIRCGQSIERTLVLQLIPVGRLFNEKFDI